MLDNLQRLLLAYGDAHGKGGVPPPLPAPKIPNRVRVPRRAAFFGRAKEMDVVMRALSPADRTWGVLVDGIGGIGKTALAIEGAHRAQGAGAFDAFVFITAKQNILAPSGIREQTPAARTLDEFLNETARVLGQPGIAKLTGDEKRRALLDVLRTMRALLIYDNLETLSKEEQEQMADFLRELPQGCKAIITSRRRGGEGAVWLRVEQLDWDAARGIIENEMARDAGLSTKLRRVESRWQELYDETNGSPLALVHTLGLMRVRAALTFDGALAMLRGRGDPAWSPEEGSEGSHTGLPLQQFIFQEARKELTTNDKSALGALSFFVPSATLEAWTQVANLSLNALQATIDRLSALSLVDVLAGEERYALHPLTRAFVRDELLADAGVARETGMRFARHWADYSKRYGGSSKNYATFNRLEAEWTNLGAAANWLWETAQVQGELVGDEDAANMLHDLAKALREFLWIGGHWDEQLQLNARGYEAMRVMQYWSSAGKHAYDVAWIYHNRGRVDDAIMWADRCAEYEKTLGARMHEMMAPLRKDTKTAERLYQDVLVIYPHIFEEWIVIALRRGECAQGCKDYDEAEKYFRQALAIYERHGEKQLMPPVLGNLGKLCLDRGREAEARKCFEQELALAREVGRVDSIADAQYSLSRVHEAEGRADLALSLAQDALKIYERLQHRDLAEVRELVERLKPPP